MKTLSPSLLPLPVIVLALFNLACREEDKKTMENEGQETQMLQEASVPSAQELLTQHEKEVPIPGGTFLMGMVSHNARPTEGPVREVTLSAYSLDVYEVTHAQYFACVQAGACSPPNSHSRFTTDLAAQSITGVTWDQAHAYCLWRGKRLPTEAEWEKAARTDQAFVFPWGNAFPSCNQANLNGCRAGLREVGKYPNDPYGTHDLIGNAWEWVSDWYAADYYNAGPATDPQGPAAGKYKVYRGGSWNSYAKAYTRAATTPNLSHLEIGFRCAHDGVNGFSSR